MAGQGVEFALDVIEVDDTLQSSSQRTRMPSQKARQNQDQLESASTTEPRTSKRGHTDSKWSTYCTENRNADPLACNAAGRRKVSEVVGPTRRL